MHVWLVFFFGFVRAQITNRRNDGAPPKIRSRLKGIKRITGKIGSNLVDGTVVAVGATTAGGALALDALEKKCRRHLSNGLIALVSCNVLRGAKFAVGGTGLLLGGGLAAAHLKVKERLAEGPRRNIDEDDEEDEDDDEGSGNDGEEEDDDGDGESTESVTASGVKSSTKTKRKEYVDEGDSRRDAGIRPTDKENDEDDEWEDDDEAREEETAVKEAKPKLSTKDKKRKLSRAINKQRQKYQTYTCT